MNILDHSTFLLFIEPTEGPALIPVIDSITKKMVTLLRSSKAGVSGYFQQDPVFDIASYGYRGVHFCSCNRAISSNQDYLVIHDQGSPIKVNKQSNVIGFITNSLCIHYLAFHRQEIPSEALELIAKIDVIETEPTQEELGNRVQ